MRARMLLVATMMLVASYALPASGASSDWFQHRVTIVVPAVTGLAPYIPKQ